MSEAIKYFQRAAEQGLLEAQFNLGAIYLNNKDISKRVPEAVMWWRKAAEGGFTRAQFTLGELYANGDGVTRNLIEAYAWLTLASATGFPNAKNRLETLEGEMSREEIEEATKLARLRFWNLRKKD